MKFVRNVKKKKPDTPIDANGERIFSFMSNLRTMTVPGLDMTKGGENGDKFVLLQNSLKQSALVTWSRSGNDRRQLAKANLEMGSTKKQKRYRPA